MVRSSHRLFVVVGLSALAAIAAGCGGSGGGGATTHPTAPPVASRPAAAPGSPNVVLIQADDEALVQFTRTVMPNTMRLLADRGTTFTDYIASTSQCCPSRASLITGQYGHNNGVLSNEEGYPALDGKSDVLPVWLQRAGYRTMHVGKFMNGYLNVADPSTEVAPGWDEWYSVLTSNTHYYGYDAYANGRIEHPQGHITPFLNHTAVDLVKRFAPRPRPFYLQLDEAAPHISYGHDPHGPCSAAAIPELRDEKAFSHARLPKPPSFNERDMTDKPGYLRNAPRLTPVQQVAIERMWRCSLDAIAGIDRGVAQVYRAVAKAGELDRTVFVFVSDNGQFYGEHRLATGKVLPYEEALRLPLVISLPKRYRAGAPPVATVDDPVANIDLAPTIAALAKAKPCGPQECRTMDGRSLLPLLRGSGGFPPNRGVLTQYELGKGKPAKYATCAFAGIRTPAAVYVVHSEVASPTSGRCIPADERELYDLRSDRFELRNRCFAGLASHCPASPLERDLAARLRKLRDCAGVKGRDERAGGRPYCE